MSLQECVADVHGEHVNFFKRLAEKVFIELSFRKLDKKHFGVSQDIVLSDESAPLAEWPVVVRALQAALLKTCRKYAVKPAEGSAFGVLASVKAQAEALPTEGGATGE